MEILKWGLLLILIGLGALATINLHPPRESGDDFQIRFKSLVVAVVVVLAYIVVVMPAVGQVPAGGRGVVLSFGAVTGQVLGEGLYLVTPFANSVEVMDVQTHAYKAGAEAASNDLQAVSTEITLNYRLVPDAVAAIYQDLRKDYEARIIVPAVQESVKATTARFTAEKLITERAKVRDGIEEALKARLGAHGIQMVAMNITNFDFSKEFNAAIEAKVQAEQNALKAQNDLVRIRVEAQQTVANAEAQATSIKIQGEALSQNPKLVELKAVEKWDGHLPQYMLGGATPFIQVPSK